MWSYTIKSSQEQFYCFIDLCVFVFIPAYVVNTMQEERKIELLDNLSIAVEKVSTQLC